MVRKIFLLILKVLLGLVVAVVLFLAVSIAPINRTPVQDTPVYAEMMMRMDSVWGEQQQPKFLSVGYSRVNLTPSRPVSLAGYGNRKGKRYTAVHDSIFVRTMVIDNGVRQVAMVSADLLIIPPTVTSVLQDKLPQNGYPFEDVYLGATHSHNSIGSWGEGVTEFLYGPYEDSIVQFIADKIILSIQEASANKKNASIKFGVIPVANAVENRLIDNGPMDSLMRVLEIHREDSTKLLFMSYTAHATCLYSKDLELSRDYPGVLVDQMEQSGYTFAMFMAGAVGSHGCNPPEYGWSCTTWMSEQIQQAFENHKHELLPLSDSTLSMVRVPLLLPKSQAKISEGWRVRSWLFRAAFHEYPVYLSALQLGDVVLLGTPCDYSGEFNHTLDSYAGQRNLHATVTSFNGGYIGYVTPSQYFDVDHYETRLMNWYGVGIGEYMTDCLKEFLDKSATRSSTNAPKTVKAEP